MKKIVLGFFIFFTFLTVSYASGNSFNVKFSSCVDGDTAKFIKNGEIITVRFLAIDTPETKHPTKGVEPYGKEASDFTCNAIKNAKKIKIEFDLNSDEKDKYNRYLGWVFVDDNLLEDELIKKGYAKVAYLYGDYKYTELLQEHEKNAKKNKLGLWGDYKEENVLYNKYLIISVCIILVLIFIFNKKGRKKIISKTKKELKKQIKKNLK